MTSFGFPQPTPGRSVDPISRPSTPSVCSSHVMDPVGIWVVHFGFLAVTLMFALGLWTRYTSFSPDRHAQLHPATPYGLFGMDTMSTILVTYMMLAPCDKAFALDSLFEKMRRKREETQLGCSPRPFKLGQFHHRCIQFHFALSTLPPEPRNSWLILVERHGPLAGVLQ